MSDEIQEGTQEVTLRSRKDGAERMITLGARFIRDHVRVYFRGRWVNPQYDPAKSSYVLMV